VLRTFFTLYVSWISIFMSTLSKHILSEYHSLLYTDIKLYGWNVISEVRQRDFEVCENQVHKGGKIRKVLTEVKWREFAVQRISSISKNRGWKVISEVKVIWSGVQIS
jgi:hypothetical protein